MHTELRVKLETWAKTLAEIRSFFDARGVIEVNTPALSPAATTDPALTSLKLDVESLGGRYFLQTSPEYAMKRLLAAGSGDIFQISRVYRDSELGRWHQPEFLLLEWYRLGFDEFALMDEVYALLSELLSSKEKPLERLAVSYREAFIDSLGVDPLDADADLVRTLPSALRERGIDAPGSLDASGLLDLALSEIVAPAWPDRTLVFLHDYPPGQAALAAIKPQVPPVAARFEVFLNGIELGNGFRELTDAGEQARRFQAELETRRAAGRDEPPIDMDFLAALESGLPECAGVAIGLERVIAQILGAESIADVINFPH